MLPIGYLAIQSPQTYFTPVSAALVSFVRTSTHRNNFGWSQECSLDDESFLHHFTDFDRQDGPAGAQAALSVLGDPNFARFGQVYSGGACQPSGFLSIQADVVRLDHFKLDNFDLGNRDFSCASMTQTKLRRVNLRGAKLAGADLSGARLADFDISGTPAATGFFRGTPFSTKAYSEIPKWQRYRCFITDLRNADMRDTVLVDAGLGGVDFEDADMTRADLTGADISRANFKNVRGLTYKMISKACAGDDNNQPRHLDDGIWKFVKDSPRKVGRCSIEQHGDRSKDNSD
jgi:uncharacterized protein YjbI with pentapeptide repeats